MNRKLIKKLSPITEEEQNILKGHQVNISHYSEYSNEILNAKTITRKNARIDIRTHTRFTPFPRHRHDFIEIMYVCSGSITHIIGEEKVVLQAGDLLFLGSNSWHEICSASRNDLGINLIINPSFFHTALHMADTKNPITDFVLKYLSKEGDANDYLHFKVSNIIPIQNLMENLIYHLCEEKGSDTLNEVTMGLLLLNLIENTELAVINTDLPKAIALKIMQYIDRNYAIASLADISNKIGVPSYKASKIVKSQFGMTFKELVLEKRLNIAERLLEDTSLSVLEIINSVGYENTSYFHRIFYQKYHCTPYAYRKNKDCK